MFSINGGRNLVVRLIWLSQNSLYFSRLWYGVDFHLVLSIQIWVFIVYDGKCSTCNLSNGDLYISELHNVNVDKIGKPNKLKFLGAIKAKIPNKIAKI